MRKDREQATVMRQSGMTYNEIKEKLGVPLSTLSQWFKDQKWSNDIAIDTISKSRNAAAIRLMVLNTVKGSRLKKVYEDAKQDALVDFHELKYHPLFISGIIIYWGNGDMASRTRISLSSMDERKVVLFVKFIEKICGIGDYRVQLLIGADFEREGEIKQHWIDTCGLKSENFLKIVKIKAKKRYNKPYFGVCNIIINSAYLKNKILKWIDLLAEEVGNEKYIAGIV